MAGFVPYHQFKLCQIKGNGTHVVDFDEDNLKIALVSNSYVPNIATDEFWATVKPAQVAGVNYTVDGTALTSKSVTVAAGVVKFTADNITWAVDVAGFTNARYAVLYKSTGVDATSALIGVLDLGQDYGNSAGDFSLRFAASGILTLA